MKKIILAAAVSVSFAIPSVASAQGWDASYPDGPKSISMFSDTAKVMSSKPVFERTRPRREECHTVIERSDSRSGSGGSEGASAAGVIVGGLVGGLLGNQVGGGSGKVVATAVGAVGGAMVGDHLAGASEGNHARQVEREIVRCSPGRAVERIAGYDVTYLYMGRTYSTMMSNEPGRRIRVNVSVTPAE